MAIDRKNIIKLKDLKGLSGCSIELMEDEYGINYVKKTSASLAYNSRLELQVQKQASFRNELITAPAVLETGYNETGLFFCLMEYVHGITFAEYLNLYSFKESRDLFDIILNAVFNTTDGRTDTEASGNIHAKINELKEKINGYDTLFERLEKLTPANISNVPVHGDLTFENILVSHDKKIFFIDFLDSFVDSPYIDMSKLNQELRLFWSVRHSNPSTGLLIRYERLADIFDGYCNSHRVNKEHLIFFSLLTILRILPYTSNNTDIDIIDKNIKKWEKELL
jgi:aminoglycoside phosphotransferase (APT) family kinase protein